MWGADLLVYSIRKGRSYPADSKSMVLFLYVTRKKLSAVAIGTTLAVQEHSCSHLFWHVIRGVKDGVHRVDLCKLHQRAIGQLAVHIKLAAPQAALKDVQRWHLRL